MGHPEGKNNMTEFVGLIKKQKTYQHLYIQMIAASFQSITLGATPLFQGCCHCSKYFWNSSFGIFFRTCGALSNVLSAIAYLPPLVLISFWKQPKVTQSHFSRMKCVNQME